MKEHHIKMGLRISWNSHLSNQITNHNRIIIRIELLWPWLEKYLSTNNSFAPVILPFDFSCGKVSFVVTNNSLRMSLSEMWSYIIEWQWNTFIHQICLWTKWTVDQCNQSAVFTKAMISFGILSLSQWFCQTIGGRRIWVQVSLKWLCKEFLKPYFS